MIYPDLEQSVGADLGRVHFVGIGGSGMHGIARMMLSRGHVVTGSDRALNANTAALQQLGVKVYEGHRAENAHGADTLVITGALWPNNPEYLYAKENNLQLLHRSQALAWLTRNRRLVAVAGAHGKTTSTGMLVTGLLGSGADPSFVNGGVIERLGVSAREGADELFVIEADESDRSFLLYETAVALITNVDPEHLDFYGSREAFMRAFVDFATAAKELVVISADDPGALEVREMLPRSTCVVTFGTAATADVRVHNIDLSGEVSFDVSCGAETARVQLNVFGSHNALNAAGAIAVLLHLGSDLQTAAAAVADFGGTKRRFEFHAEVASVRVYDDYAHHHTEVAALLKSVKPVVGAAGRVIALHQPHLFSRTATFYAQFAAALENNADYTIVLPVDGAREDPVPGVTGELVANAFTDQARVAYFDNWADVVAHAAAVARPGDVFITMSCGTAYQIIPDFVAALIARFGDTECRFAADFKLPAGG
ncbi:UDP-N-acetylmuramate--L-alanine ligase [Canibacter sp. lx-45]|uniref:UDP-N-acetylmuramate--L-alanine ligase n=1 Tax=Canibacter zhuwentaonis TaxID=2837491 RepID=UPI001BDD7508|nr:UDP-N-acetylmuramate--L-alanine ligase [Canibacter zhuwentaonis]MBT1035258.1 UDP-N-acetylmuramate--L-alanine ligase [Canibacter zhuwentaonis]